MVVAALGWTMACSSGSGEGGSDGKGGSAAGGTGGGSAGSGTGGGAAGAGGAQACNAITNSGPTVNETRIAEAMPAMTGGMLVDGTYELIQWELYTGPAGATGATGTTKKLTLTMAAGAWQVVELEDAADTIAFTLTCAPSGTSVNCTITCPIAGSFSLPYTITTSSSGTELQLLDTNSTPNHLGTWVKR